MASLIGDRPVAVNAARRIGSPVARPASGRSRSRRWRTLCCRPIRWEARAPARRGRSCLFRPPRSSWARRPRDLPPGTPRAQGAESPFEVGLAGEEGHHHVQVPAARFLTTTPSGSSPMKPSGALTRATVAPALTPSLAARGVPLYPATVGSIPFGPVWRRGQGTNTTLPPTDRSMRPDITEAASSRGWATGRAGCRRPPADQLHQLTDQLAVAEGVLERPPAPVHAHHRPVVEEHQVEGDLRRSAPRRTRSRRTDPGAGWPAGHSHCDVHPPGRRPHRRRLPTARGPGP